MAKIQKAVMKAPSGGEAMAQIQAVMAAPNDPVAVVILRANGSCEEVVTDQRKIGQVLGGVPTVVGAIMSLGVQAVGKQGAKGKSKHEFPTETFEPNMKGDVILFRTGEDAEPMAFTAAEYNSWVAAGRPDEAQESDEDDEEIEGEEEDESDDEDSDDEDVETFENFSARMSELPITELRKAAKLCGLDVKGGKDALLTRMYEHAQENASEEESDEENGADEEEAAAEAMEEEEEQPKAKKGKTKSPAVAKAAGKARVSPGPVKKTIAKAGKGKERRRA